MGTTRCFTKLRVPPSSRALFHTLATTSSHLDQFFSTLWALFLQFIDRVTQPLNIRTTSCYPVFSVPTTRATLLHFFATPCHLHNQWGRTGRALFIKRLRWCIQPLYILTTFGFSCLTVPRTSATTLEFFTGFSFFRIIKGRITKWASILGV
jgi:hypothetical protein